MAEYSDILSALGGSDSNSYVSGVEADSFAAFQSWNAAWLEKTESERTIALVNACRWMETITFNGTRCSPSTDDENLPQALSWPRSGASCDGVEATCSFIPGPIKEAQILIAYNLVLNPELITGSPGGGGGAPSGTYVSQQQLGDLSISYAEYTNNDSQSANECATCSTPAIIAALPWLRSLLSCWADISESGGNKVLLRVRS